MMMRNLSHCLNRRHQTSVAIGTLKNSVAHAFCASLYASCLFRPVILSLNLTQSSASITSLRFARGDGWTGERKYTDNERWVIVICKTRNAEYT